MRRIHDVVVIGSGLAGSWATHELAHAGVSVLLLDAGPLLAPDAQRRGAWSRDRRAERAAARQPVQSQHPAYWAYNPDLFIDDVDHPYSVAKDARYVWVRGRQVGGRSLTWGGVSPRFSDFEFRGPEIDSHGARWPIRHVDLVPFYERVERVMRVRGTAAGLPQLPDGVFVRPSRLSQHEAAFASCVEARWKDRRVLPLRDVGARSHRDAKQGPRAWSPRTTLRTLVPAALRTTRVALRPNAIVARLITNATHRITAIGCIDRESHRTFEVSARVVVLCASTIESLRILLNSSDSSHPTGLGNSSGLLGRCLLDHWALGVGGLLPQAECPASGGATTSGLMIPRFVNLAAQEQSFVRGYGVWGRMASPADRQSPTWFLNAVGEVLPNRDNRVTLDHTTRDAWGLPTASIEMRYGDNERRMRQDAAQALRDLVRCAGLRVSGQWVTAPGQYVHELGGAPMGADPGASVLNAYNRSWDVPNLFVVDGSCFVTAGWQNPSLTIMALAARAARHIAAELRAGRL